MAINKPKPRTAKLTPEQRRKDLAKKYGGSKGVVKLAREGEALQKATGSRRATLLEAARKAQSKQTGGHARPTGATTKQETGSYYGTTGSSGYVSGKVMPAHTTQKEKAAGPASKFAKQTAAYKKAHAKGGIGSMSGMLAAAGGIGNIANMKALHAAAYPKAKTGTTKTGTTKTATTKQTPAERRKSLLSKYGGTSSVRTGRS
tara:strand:- start:622 stop:1230 length:609 start_codon:yes stop_codon:yes gene_type:complete